MQKYTFLSEDTITHDQIAQTRPEYIAGGVHSYQNDIECILDTSFFS